MRLKLLTAGLLSATMLASAANAEIGYYAQFNVGASRALDTKYSGTTPIGSFFYDGNLGTSVLVGGEIGAKLSDYFRMGVSLDYRPGYSNESDNGLWELKTSSLAPMANMYLDITQTDNGFTPYITAGAGMAFNEQKATYEYNSNVNFASKKTSGFAWKAGLGTKVKLNDSFDMDIRYQFVDLGKVELGDYSDGSRTYTNTTTKSAKLRANEIILGLAYKF